MNSDIAGRGSRKAYLLRNLPWPKEHIRKMLLILDDLFINRSDTVFSPSGCSFQRSNADFQVLR